MASYTATFVAKNNVDWNEPLQLTQDSTPLSIAGAEIRMTVVDSNDKPVMTLTNGKGIQIINEALGKFRILQTAARMKSLPLGTYKHDAILIRAGSTSPLWQGTLTVTQGYAGILDVTV